MKEILVEIYDVLNKELNVEIPEEILNYDKERFKDYAPILT
jgi:hypothetical protein